MKRVAAFGFERGLVKDVLTDYRDTLAYTLRSQNRDPESPTRGGLYLFYDLEARTFRTSYWVWGWAPSVKLLLEAERIREVASGFKTKQLRKVGEEIGQTSLRFQVKDKNHPANGSVLVRWD